MLLSETITMEELENIEVTRPERAGTRWKGIRHADLVHAIEDQLNYRNIRIIENHFSVSKDEFSLIGYAKIAPDMEPIEGQSYMLGYRHSNDLRFPITLSIGTIITICHNGVITGEHILRRKHTSGLDLEREMFDAVRDVTGRLNSIPTVINGMRHTRLDNHEYYLVEGARRGIYPWSWIGKIDSEYNSPDDDNQECLDYKGTRWGLYNAFNFVMHEATNQRQVEGLYQFNLLLNN